MTKEQLIELKSYLEKNFKKKLAPVTIAAMVAAGYGGLQSGEAIYSYANEKPTTTAEQEKNETIKEVSEDFEQKKDAENWLSEKEKNKKDNYDVTNKKIIEKQNQIISTEKTEINESFDTEQEAIDRKSELEKSDIESSSLKITERKEEKKVTERVEIKETFDTEEEKNEFVDANKDKTNFNVTESVSYTEWESKGTEQVAEETGLTEEQINAKIEQIKSDIESNNTDTVRYEVDITKTSNTEKIQIEDKKTNESKTFDTLEEANAYITNLKLLENENITVTITGPTEEQVFKETNTEAISKTFDSEEEANDFIEQLKSEGYTVSDTNVTEKEVIEYEKVETGNVIVNNSNKLDSNNSFSVKANYIMIKQASGTVVIWTEGALSETQQSSFINSWLNGSYDPSVSSNFTFKFISGAGTHDLSSIGNQWGSYDISIDGDAITMKCDKDRISHLNYGTMEKEYKEIEKKVKKYDLTGNKSIDLYDPKYKVLSEILEKQYKEEITYGYSISKEKFERDKEFILEGYFEEEKIIESLKYNLTGYLIKNIRGTKYYAIIEMQKKDELEKKYEEELDSVKTGDEENLTLAYAGLGIGALGAAGVAYTRRRQKRN